MAMTKKNSNIMIILSFLYKLVDVLTEYFNELEVHNQIQFLLYMSGIFLQEESIRDNFVIIFVISPW